jgi:hypothetical protein
MEGIGSDELFSVAMVTGGRERKEELLWCLREGRRGRGKLQDDQLLLPAAVASCCVASRA